MARPQVFDTDRALTQAMLLFWEKGYANTSIEDLVASTKVSRQGLYKIFKNKRGLFLACLDKYYDTIANHALYLVEKPEATVTDIEAYFARLFELSSSPSGRRGCMMANTPSDIAAFDTQAAARVERFRQRQQSSFKRALLNTHQDPPLTESEAYKYADFLTTQAQGIAMLARAGADPKAIANSVEVTLNAIV